MPTKTKPKSAGKPVSKKAEPKPKAPPVVPHVPADPVAALNADRAALTEKAIAAVHDALEADEGADASALYAARNLFEAYKFHNEFAYLLTLAYAAGGGK